MKFGALLGWGLVIYAVMYTTWAGFALYGFTDRILPRVFLIAVLVIVATSAGRALRFHNWRDILPYSFSWALMAIFLDAVYAAPSVDWIVWARYALIVSIPLLAPQTRTASYPLQTA